MVDSYSNNWFRHRKMVYRMVNQVKDGQPATPTLLTLPILKQTLDLLIRRAQFFPAEGD